MRTAPIYERTRHGLGAKATLEVTDGLVALIDILEKSRLRQTADAALTQAAWNDVVNNEKVPDIVLADIAGVTTHHRVRVGRSHPLFGMQPSEGHVARAKSIGARMRGGRGMN